MAIFDRAEAFCARFGLELPILLAPMAGASAPTLSAAVINAGGLNSPTCSGIEKEEPSDV
jgi:nitronate monooxygenase